MKIRSKMLVSFIGIILVILFFLGIIFNIIINNYITATVKSDLNNTMDFTLQLVNSNLDNSIKNYLRGIAEKNRDLIAYYYGLSKNGTMNESEALKKIKEIFVDPEYGKIGATGYLAGVSTKGILTIHPKSEGADVSKLDFG
jgi:methyl-accepting chemotaxis protein